MFSIGFQAMEKSGLLDSDNDLHLYCLHYVFLPVIRHATKCFQQMWNWHGMKTVGLGGDKPVKQWHLGKPTDHCFGLSGQSIDVFHFKA
jgi:hypothetical protein